MSLRNTLGTRYMNDWLNPLAVPFFQYAGYVFLAHGLMFVAPSVLPASIYRRRHRRRVRKWQRQFGYRYGDLKRRVSGSRPSQRRRLITGLLFLIAGVYGAGGWHAVTARQMPGFTAISFAAIPLLVILNLLLVSWLNRRRPTI